MASPALPTEWDAAPKLQVIPGSTATSATFVVNHEDHTLGNALRYMLMRDPATEFCGYSMPHPSEPLVNVRLQTRDVAAVDVFRRGLQSLVAVAEHVSAAFVEATGMVVAGEEAGEGAGAGAGAEGGEAVEAADGGAAAAAMEEDGGDGGAAAAAAGVEEPVAKASKRKGTKR